MTKESAFSKYFRNSTILMAITNAEDGTFIDANDTYLEAFGYTREETIGRLSIDTGVITKETRDEKIKKDLDEIGHVVNKEIKLKTKSGEDFYVIYCAEIIDFRGEKRLLSVAQDITKRKKMEIELIERNKELEKINDELKYVIEQMEETDRIKYENNNLKKLRELTMRLKAV